MTALFLVIFAENWLKEKSHESSLLGLGVAFASLLIVGKNTFSANANQYLDSIDDTTSLNFHLNWRH